ncbi:patatin-like phospholipase family protein [Phycicoccus sp. Soil748]|uniref:patatin-like phospholipase family protein n=1 Tax=Phycicoccus sp. Soil748 TaxID=1736397 RepID=UPI00071385FB|nr:patatin-like phospholipase family protein [Phycicoccus sp. Soil748]KRE54667.1 hypothetical protein ASG70_10965 [Phycicoccus sp. Soil748]
MSTDQNPPLTVPEPLGRPEAYASPPATCDVVMKGGITSGIVYPWAVCDLATRYRLVNVGGTSAGAIAAAAAAAAEYGRHRPGAGYPVLAGLPGVLGGTHQGRSRLFTLFQPQRRTAPLHALFVASLGGGGGGSRTGLALRGLRSAAMAAGGWWRLLLGALAGLLLLVAAGASGAAWGLLAVVAAVVLGAGVGRLVGRAPVALGVAVLVLVAVVVAVGVSGAGTWATTLVGVLGWLLLVVGLLAGTVWVLGRVLLRDVPDNLYGMCSGMEGDGFEGSAALTPWLTDLLDRAAGLRSGAASGAAAGAAERGPLTFGHLWAGPGAPRIAGTARPESPAINLEVMTTCVTRSRPYRMPFESVGFYVDPGGLRRLFPPAVVDWVLAHPAPVGGSPTDRRRRRVADELLAPLVPFPAAADVPVVVAARMSLSFPVLISAVPLHAVDRATNTEPLDRISAALTAVATEQATEADAAPGDLVSEDAVVREAVRRLRAEGVSLRADRVWFSDGGITSNFPIHFFDSFAPTRPTFGVNLRPHHPAHPPVPGDESSSVYLPIGNGAGRAQAPNLFDAAGPTLPGFAKAILDTMQNWNDLLQLPLPGFRDRIAHVSLSPEEGGMNLAMPPSRIAALARRGQLAGQVLRERFSLPGENGWTGWENHRWLRLRTSLSLVEVAGGQVERALGPAGSHPDGTHSFKDLLDLPVGGAPSYNWENQTQRRRARTAVAALAGASPTDVPETQRLGHKAPQPMPALRITPRE